MDGCPVADRCCGDPHRLAQVDDVADGLLVEPRLRLCEEVVALRSAEHDGHLVLAEFGQTDHRADVEPVLTGQAVDADQSVGSADDAEHGCGLGVWRTSLALHPLRHQHRIRQRRQQRFEGRDVHLDQLTGVGGGQPQGRQRPESRVGACHELRDARAGLHRRSIRIANRNPPRGRLHRQRRGFAIPQRTVLAEVGDPYDDETRVDAAQGVAIEAPRRAVERPRREVLDEDVRRRDEFSSQRAIVLIRQIQTGSALSGVDVLEQPGPLGVGDAVGKRSPSSQRVAAGRFDLEDVRTEVDEQLGAVGARDVATAISTTRSPASGPLTGGSRWPSVPCSCEGPAGRPRDRCRSA